MKPCRNGAPAPFLQGVENLVGMEHLLRFYKVFTRVTGFGHRGFHLATKDLTRLLTPKGGRRIQDSLLAGRDEPLEMQ